MSTANIGLGMGPFDKTDAELRIEALRQAVDLWKHWDDSGHPDDGVSLVGVAQRLHGFLAGSQE